MMKISIVTVTFNSEETIARAIESVLLQTYTPYEYIVVDGASSDNTVNIIKKYAEKFKELGIKFCVVSEPDQGIYDAMNKGIKMATGDIVGMINSDDWYEPVALQTVAETYEITPFDLFYADLRIIKQSGNFTKKSKTDRFPSTRHWNHPTTFISKSMYSRYQYENKTIYDDWDLILRVRGSGCKPVIVNRILANFTFGGCSNEKSIRKAIERFWIRYKIYKKNGYNRLYILECAIMEIVKYIAS